MELLIKMKTALLAFATALWLAPAHGFVSVSPGPIQRHQTAKHTHLPPTRRRRDRPSTAHALASGAEAGLFSSLSLASIDAGLLSSPVFWSVSVMLTIVGLLKAWELSVEASPSRRTPPTPSTREIINERINK